MKIVFAVFYTDPDPVDYYTTSQLHKIFATKESAEEFIDGCEDYDIEEWEVEN